MGLGGSEAVKSVVFRKGFAKHFEGWVLQAPFYQKLLSNGRSGHVSPRDHVVLEPQLLNSMRCVWDLLLIPDLALEEVISLCIFAIFQYDFLQYA